MKTKAIDLFDHEELIHSSFRYYLGRRTIATCAFADNLAKAMPLLSENTRGMILRELKKAFEEEARNPDWKPLGDECDKQAWQGVLDAAEK
jgi:hypothetical protein